MGVCDGGKGFGVGRSAVILDSTVSNWSYLDSTQELNVLPFRRTSSRLSRHAGLTTCTHLTNRFHEDRNQKQTQNGASSVAKTVVTIGRIFSNFIRFKSSADARAWGVGRGRTTQNRATSERKKHGVVDLYTTQAWVADCLPILRDSMGKQSGHGKN